ncbi:MAG: PfkB family carbohydrate kinase [Lentisphaeria bacterium]
MSDEHLKKFITHFPEYRVAVVGDLMLDRYTWGSATRISQEAPVPVVKVARETQAPGGAANVVANLLGLGSKAGTFGFVGDDLHGNRLRKLLVDSGAEDAGIFKHPKRHTTVKTRVICNHQQVVRIDHEAAFPLGPGDDCFVHLKQALCENLKAGYYDALIFEDYAKGLLSAELMEEVVEVARDNGVVTALDPHPSHNFKVKNLSLITPNRAEAFALAGMYAAPAVTPLKDDKSLLEVGRCLLEQWAPQHLLITLGGQGMALFTLGAEAPLHIPTRAKSVYDVSGAGDTVTASFVLALLSGASPRECAQVANHAAGIVVGKVGTVPVTVAELLENLEESCDTDE